MMPESRFIHGDEEFHEWLASEAKGNKITRRPEKTSNEEQVRIKIGAHCGPLIFFLRRRPAVPPRKISYSFGRCFCLPFPTFFISIYFFVLILFSSFLSFFFSFALLAVRGRANSRSLISFTVQRGFAPQDPTRAALIFVHNAGREPRELDWHV